MLLGCNRYVLGYHETRLEEDGTEPETDTKWGNQDRLGRL